jgi:hypothetical protein
MRWLVSLRTLAVITRFARRAGAVLAIAEAFARRVLVGLPWTAIAGHDDLVGSSHLSLAATDVRERRQPVAGQRQQCHEDGQ